MKAISDTFVAYRLVWIRVAFYFLTPAATLFLTQTETWSQGTWDALGAFLKGRLFLACFIAGGTGFCAYIDSSLQSARATAQDLKAKRTQVAAALLPENG